MANGLLLQVFWLCALLINGCAGATISKDYRFRSQSQNRNTGDDADDERLISSASEDRDSKPASLNTPQWGSSQQGVQTRPGGRDVGQLNRVAQVSMEKDPNKPLVFPLSVPANPQLGAVNQQSKAPALKRVRYEDVFDFRSQNSGPAQHYGAGRGYNEGRNPQHLVSRSSINTGMPLYQGYPLNVAGPTGVVYRNLAPISYNEGLNSKLQETVPQRASGQAVPLPPPLPYNPVYLTQSRSGYSHARYTHSHSKYSPDPYAPMTVDPQPLQDVPGVKEEAGRGKW